LNKKIRDSIIGVIIIVVMLFLVIWVYNREANKDTRELAKHISELSSKGGPPETIEDLEKAIALYEAQIELNIKDGIQTGSYWKILGIRQADRGQHKSALEAYDNAKNYITDDPTLFWLIGESAIVAARSVVDVTPEALTEKDRYYKLAENSYLRSIELDAVYGRPLFGIGALYTFDLDRPAEAIPHLERFLQINTNNVTAMFVLARACYMEANSEGTGRGRALELNERAIELYDRIISLSGDPKVREEAAKNKETIGNR